MMLENRFFERADGRYYVIEPACVDLLGDTVIMTRHGSRFNRLGGHKAYVATPETTRRCVDALIALRLRHGYREMPTANPDAGVCDDSGH